MLTNIIPMIKSFIYDWVKLKFPQLTSFLRHPVVLDVKKWMTIFYAVSSKSPVFSGIVPRITFHLWKTHIFFSTTQCLSNNSDLSHKPLLNCSVEFYSKHILGSAYCCYDRCLLIVALSWLHIKFNVGQHQRHLGRELCCFSIKR